MARKKGDERALPFTRIDHDERAASQKSGDKIAGHTEDELRDMLRRTGRVPAGVSYSPYSATPFVEVTDKDHERIVAAQRSYDTTVNYPNAVGVATDATPSGVADTGASTGGDAGTGGSTT